jgi:nicotinate phosphoribosyltransferase
MNINWYPIINSLLDTDLYKLTQGQVVFFKFSDVKTEWKFINRGKTVFPPGFADELEKQIQFLSQLTLLTDETEYLNTLPYMRPAFVEWFGKYQFDPSEVEVTQVGGDLSIRIFGSWYRNIYWEVPLMAIISELYFLMTGQTMEDGWTEKIGEKAYQLGNAGCLWSDFGTRRRYSFNVQDMVVHTMRSYRGFQGTSNPYLAMKYGVPVVGTSAHEAQMAMSAKYGARNANRVWLEAWSQFYRGRLGIALTDTYTTDIFLKDFDGYFARLFDGCRHDSSDPIAWGEKILAHYAMLGIDATTKKLVFSDNLNVPKYIAIHTHFTERCIPIAGIGTNFSNDVGVRPLNMVIKMTAATGGFGVAVDVVKLSDDIGKNTGDSDTIRKVKESLNIS